MIDYKKENKELIEKSGRYTYYDFTQQNIEKIINKDINDVENNEWRILIQMLYPEELICRGLLQPIVIFKVNKNGKRIDPPIEAYNGIDDLVNDTCLLFRIIEHIEKNGTLKIDNSWYKVRDKILSTKEAKYEQKNRRSTRKNKRK